MKLFNYYTVQKKQRGTFETPKYIFFYTENMRTQFFETVFFKKNRLVPKNLKNNKISKLTKRLFEPKITKKLKGTIWWNEKKSKIVAEGPEGSKRVGIIGLVNFREN